MELRADDQCGKPCLGYKIQLDLPPETKRALGVVQGLVRTNMPLPLYLSPPHSLHITVFTMLSPRLDRADKEEIWQGISARCAETFKRVGAGLLAVDLLFDAVRVTPTAVIATARDRSGTIDTIRQHFSDLMAGLELPSATYTLIHTTLARFPEAYRLSDQVETKIAALPISIPAAGGRIALIRERVYPARWKSMSW